MGRGGGYNTLGLVKSPIEERVKVQGVGYSQWAWGRLNDLCSFKAYLQYGGLYGDDVHKATAGYLPPNLRYWVNQNHLQISNMSWVDQDIRSDQF